MLIPRHKISVRCADFESAQKPLILWHFKIGAACAVFLGQRATIHIHTRWINMETMMLMPLLMALGSKSHLVQVMFPRETRTTVAKMLLPIHHWLPTTTTTKMTTSTLTTLPIAALCSRGVYILHYCWFDYVLDRFYVDISIPMNSFKVDKNYTLVAILVVVVVVVVAVAICHYYFYHGNINHNMHYDRYYHQRSWPIYHWLSTSTFDIFYGTSSSFTTTRTMTMATDSRVVFWCLPICLESKY